MVKIAALKLKSSHSLHKGACWSLALNPTKLLLASAGADRQVSFLLLPGSSLSGSSEIEELESYTTAHTRTIRCVSWSPSGLLLATASFDGTIKIHSRPRKSWVCDAVLEGHENEVKSVAFSSDGRTLASAGRDKSVWVWEITEPPPQPDMIVDDGDGFVDDEEMECDRETEEFEVLSVLLEHQGDVKSVCFSPDSELIMSAGYDDAINLYAPSMHEEYALVRRITTHKSTVWCAKFTRNGRIISCSADGNLALHDIEGKLLSTFEAAHSRAIYSIDLCGDLVVSGGADGAINIFSVSDSDDILSFGGVQEAHGVSEVNCVLWIDQETIASAGDDGMVKVWHVELCDKS